MKLFLLTFFNIIFLVNSKLITTTIEEKNGNPPEEFNKEILISKEEARDGSNEYFKFYNKRVRIPRDSNENTLKLQNVTKHKRTFKPKVTLVKKPIPKFIDLGSEEDYQIKTRFPNKYSDSIEHEDEDFNLDDYDFDVNHDEFAGRGKPLEPRIKVKVNREKIQSGLPKLEVKTRPEPVLSQRKVVIPQNKGKASVKVARKAADKMKEDEYDDEFLASTKAPETPLQLLNKGRVSDENEDSKEEEIKSPVRTVRSPLTFGTYVDKLGEKTSAFMSKILTYLPIFPQSDSTPYKLHEEIILQNDPMVDPWLGRPVI